VFGFILALTTASVGSPTFYNIDGSQMNLRFDGRNFDDFRFEFQREFSDAIDEMRDFVEGEIPSSTINTWIAIGVGILCLFLILFIVGRVLRYVSEVAMIRMVDDYEERGETLSVRQGFRLGWSRSAWRLFLINLVIDLPVTVLFLLLLVLIALPLLFWGADSVAVGVIGTIASIGFFFLLILLAIVTGTAIRLLKKFMRRACVLEDIGIIPAIVRGWQQVRENLKEVGLMWLILFGVNLIWPIVMIPIGILLFIVAGIFGGAAALAAAGLGGLFLEGLQVWLVAGLVGFPIFLLLFLFPLSFFNGLFNTYTSSTWTLTYRELQAVKGLQPEALPEP
jgi:hypothetical protein